MKLIIKSFSVAIFDTIFDSTYHEFMENRMFFPMVYVICHLTKKVGPYGCLNLGVGTFLDHLVQECTPTILLSFAGTSFSAMYF